MEMVETEMHASNTTLEIRIENFCTTTTEVSVRHFEYHEYFAIEFSASVFPNGFDEDTEGWLGVLPEGDIYNAGRIFKDCITMCVVSIIDIEGNLRFLRSFEPDVEDEFRGMKYLEKSLILDRRDELLPDGVLRLRCEIDIDPNDIKPLMLIDGSVLLGDHFALFLRSIPQVVCLKKGAETGGQRDTFTVFDLTHRILNLPQFHWLRKRFGVKGIPPVLTSISPESKVGIKHLKEHVWIFETNRDRFLLSLAQRPGNVGSLLVAFSPVIRRCINAPMREKLEKRIQLSNVDSLTFQIVLHFLESGRFPNYGFRNSVKVYEFSCLYEMEKLQQRSAEGMLEASEVDFEFEEIEAIADLYSDEYLLTLLESKRREIVDSVKFRMDDRPNFDCYI